MEDSNRKHSELYIEGKNPGQAMERLFNIVKLLRKQCPWDKAQTHESLVPDLIEETYETVNAIRRDDIDNLREELGDVMLQVVLHSEIASEKDDFSITEVINQECEKMIRRHPHIFLEDDAKTIDKVLEKWENIKDGEHQYISQSEKIKDIPDCLPALMRAYKVQSKVAKTGFDWNDSSGAIEKLFEEIEEFLEEYKAGNKENMNIELGDVLFSAVNIARFAEVNPEMALTESTEKFIKRFFYVEKKAEALNKNLNSMSLEEMDKLWNEAKSIEKED